METKTSKGGEVGLTVKAFAGMSMMSQWRLTPLSCEACSMSSGANLPTALAMGSTPLRTKEGSLGRRKCLGLSGLSRTNNRFAVPEWSNRGVGQMLPGVLAGGAWERMASTRLLEKQLLMSGWISLLPIRLVTVRRDQIFTPIAWDCSCSLPLMLNCLAKGGWADST